MPRFNGFRFKVGRTAFGMTFDRSFLRPCSEGWGHEDCGGSYWYAQAFGVSVWRDSLPAVCVSDRGVW